MNLEPDPIRVYNHDALLTWRIEIPTTGTGLDGGVYDTPSRHDALILANIAANYWGLTVVVAQGGQWVCAHLDGAGGICGAVDGQPHHERHGEEP